MAKFRSASRRISTTGSGWRHSQNAAAIRATSAIEKNKTMKPLSNQSSVCPRSRTTSRHAKPAATRTIPSPSIRSLPLRQDQRHNPDRNVDKEDPPPTPVVCDPPAERRADHGGSHDGHAVESGSRRPLLRRKRVHENGLLDRRETTASDALQDAEEDEQAQ